MPQGRHAAGLTQKPLQSLWRIQYPALGPLERDRATKLGVPRPVNDRERASSDHVLQLVPPDALVWLRPRVDLSRRVNRCRSGRGWDAATQGSIGLDQLEDGVGVGSQVRKSRQVGIDVNALACLDPNFQLLVDQLQQHHLSIRALLGGILLDHRPLPAHECFSERPDHFLYFSPGRAVQFGS